MSLNCLSTIIFYLFALYNFNFNGLLSYLACNCRFWNFYCNKSFLYIKCFYLKFLVCGDGVLYFFCNDEIDLCLIKLKGILSGAVDRNFIPCVK